MIEHLLFRIYGPMVSWGSIAVGEERATHLHPTKSSIMGLVAGAFGLTREMDDEHLKLNKTTGYAVEVLNRGTPLRDFHTAQVPQKYRNTRWFSRKDELQKTPGGINTVTSNREYLNDAFYTICLWKKKNKTSCYPLPDIKEALQKPKFIPYLGRKSCPPGIFFNPKLVETKTLYEAFQNGEFSEELDFADLSNEQNPFYFWDKAHPNSGLEVLQEHRIRDEVVSRSRWQFANRWEFRGIRPRNLEKKNADK